MQNSFLALAAVAAGLTTALSGAASDLMCGSCCRPARGKVCKLVCETATLTAVGYGCEWDTICIPGPSRPGCKHGYRTCCCDSEPKCCPPKIDFCWRDWIACGCARPRNVKVLTKYQAEKEIDWYHWEVVDAACCGCASCCGAVDSNVEVPASENAAVNEVAPAESPSSIPATPIGFANSTDGRVCIYKPAPPGSQIGDVFAVGGDERSQLARWMGAQLDQDAPASAAIHPRIGSNAGQPIGAVEQAAATEPADDSAWRGISRLIGIGN